MNYLDASVVVALLTPEVGSDRAEAWLQATEDKPCISPWVNSEVSSALSIKVRTNALSLETRAIALADWHRLRDASLAIEPSLRTISISPQLIAIMLISNFVRAMHCISPSASPPAIAS